MAMGALIAADGVVSVPVNGGSFIQDIGGGSSSQTLHPYDMTSLEYSFKGKYS